MVPEQCLFKHKGVLTLEPSASKEVDVDVNCLTSESIFIYMVPNGGQKQSVKRGFDTGTVGVRKVDVQKFTVDVNLYMGPNGGCQKWLSPFLTSTLTTSSERVFTLVTRASKN